jgi:two-component system LytT family sensor kinase
MQRIASGRTIFLAWTVIGLFYAGRSIVTFAERPGPIPWDRAVLFELIYWYVWAALTPLVLRFAQRFPLQGEHWVRNVLALIFFGLIVSPLQSLAEAGISLLIGWSLLHLPAHEAAMRWAIIQRRLPIESVTGFSVYAGIVGAAYALNAYRKAAQLENALATAELRNLKSQLHPHFLFNTLHTISVLMMRDVPLANRVLIRLSELLRAALDTHGGMMVPLRQEMEFVEGYLEIEQTRFQDRLMVHIEIDPMLLNARVPSFLLQPLVENALRHGIANLSGTGQLSVEAKRDGARIRMAVRDNGPGASGVRDSGVGLANLRARLQQLYGADCKFEAGNADGGGFLVHVSIPFQESRA